jgi:hypothetical protein
MKSSLMNATRLTLVVSFVVLVCVYSFSRVSYSKIAPPSINCPTQIDLGGCESGQEVEAKFSVTNNGGQPLFLYQFTTSCSCAGVLKRRDSGGTEPAERIAVAPGDAVELIARIVIRGVPGMEAKTAIAFQTNDPLNPVYQVMLVAPRVLGLVADPVQVTFLDASEAGGESRTVALRTIGTGTPGLKNVESTHPAFKVTIVPHGSAEGEFAKLQIAFLGSPIGSVGGEVLAAIESEGLSKVISIPVAATVSPPIILTPSFVTLPLRSSSGLVYDVLCAVRTRKGEPFTAHSDSVPDGVTVEVLDPDVAAPMKYVRVGLVPPVPPIKRIEREYSVALTVRTSAGDRRVVLSVKCTGEESK